MTKDADGIWSVTVAPLAPELWGDTYSVDGVRTVDAQWLWRENRSPASRLRRMRSTTRGSVIKETIWIRAPQGQELSFL